MDTAQFVSFSSHVNRATANVRLLEWSPINDLVAVVYDEPTITLYRLPWQQVWIFKSNAHPTTLCWSLNGQMLAIGCVTGTIMILSKENGALLWKLPQVANGGILALSWVKLLDQYKPTARSFDTLTMKLKALFSEIPLELPTERTSVESFYSKMNSVQVQEGEIMEEADCESSTILIVARNRGHIVFYLQGKVPILEFTSSLLLNSHHPEEANIHSVTISSDLSAILVLQSVSRVSSDPNLTTKSTVQLLVCEAPNLLDQFTQIQDLSLRLYEMIDLVDKSMKCLHNISRSWSSMVKSFHNLLTLEGVDLSSLREELVIFLGMQSITKALQKFCDSKWNCANLKKMAKDIDSTFHLTDEIITGHLRNYLQKAVIIAEDLHSILECSELLLEHNLGIQMEHVNHFRTKLKWSLLRLNSLQEKMSSLSKDYRLFMCFLTLIQKCSNNNDISDVNITNQAMKILDFIQNGVFQDPVIAELEHKDNGNAASSFIEEWKGNKGLWDVLCGVLGKLPDNEHYPGLATQLMQCKRFANSSLVKIKETVSENINLKHKESLAGSISSPVDCLKLHSYFNAEENLHQFLLLLNCLEGRLRTGLASIVVIRGTITKSSERLLSRLEPSIVLPSKDYVVVDLALCRTSQLLILMKDKTSLKGEFMSIEMSHWPFIDREKTALAERRSPDELVKSIKDHAQELDQIEKRQRPHNYLEVRSPLAVSNTNLAIVVSDHRVIIYDLETDDQTD